MIADEPECSQKCGRGRHGACDKSGSVAHFNMCDICEKKLKVLLFLRLLHCLVRYTYCHCELYSAMHCSYCYIYVLFYDLQAIELVSIPINPSISIPGVCYTFENTCLLSVYAYPTWEMVCGVKTIEVRCSECSFQHVIVCCSFHEDAASGIPPGPDWMQKGCAYLVFSVGKFLALTGKRCVGWEMQDTKVLRIPFQLRAGEYPKQGPHRLDKTKSGHVSLLRTLNNGRNFV
jgi:hypothetical protein